MNTVHKGVDMPKIIKDIEKKIIDASKTCFETYGYKQVDMRKIAKEAGIAVGTLYNYFPNKDALYKESLASSWQETVDVIATHFETEHKTVSDLYKGLEYFYEGLENRKGLGRQMMLGDLAESMEHNKELHEASDTALVLRGFWTTVINELIAAIEKVAQTQVCAYDKAEYSYLAGTWVGMVAMLVPYPGTKDEKLTYLNKSMQMAFKK